MLVDQNHINSSFKFDFTYLSTAYSAYSYNFYYNINGISSSIPCSVSDLTKPICQINSISVPFIPIVVNFYINITQQFYNTINIQAGSVLYYQTN